MIKKRILVIGISHAIGGVETFLIGIFRNINKEKIEMDFLTFWPVCAYERELLQAGCHIYHFTRRGQNPIKNYFQLKKFFQHNRKTYDYIWINLPSASNCLANVLARKYTGAKIISHSHGSQLENQNDLSNIIHSFLHDKNKAKLLRCTNYCFACSKVASEWLFGKNCPKCIYIIKNGIDTKKFKFDNTVRDKYRKKLGLEHKLILGHVGRFTVVKNQKYIIEIFNCLHAINKNTYLLLIGEGKNMQQIQDETKFYHLENNISFLGFRDDISQLMQAMDIFLLPSLYEGFPLTAVEAQASGLPCFLSDSISREVNITDLVQRLSIKEAPAVWAKSINSTSCNLNRAAYASKVSEAGYDIKTTAKELENFFLTH